MNFRSILGRYVRARPALHRAYWDCVKFRTKPLEEMTVWWDWFRTWREASFLRTMPCPTPTRSVLIISLSEMVYKLKTDAMFGVALRRQGLKPIALVHSRVLSGREQHYFCAFGIDDFAFLEDFPLTEEEKMDCEEVARRLLDGPLTFQTVKEWTYEGSWIGPQILSTVSRQQFAGAPNPADPVVRKEIEALLPKTLSLVHQARKMISAVNPALAVACEVNYVYYGPITDMAIAKGVDVIQYNQPWEDNGYMLKRLNATTRRMHPSSISPQTFEAICDAPWTDKQEVELSRVFTDRYEGRWFLQSRNQPMTIKFTSEEIITQLRLDQEKKVAVVFCPVIWDANIFYGEDLFEDFGEWFVETVKAAAANPTVSWIIKLHPANIWKRNLSAVDGPLSEEELIDQNISNLPSHVSILQPDTNISTFCLFEVADFCVTVRGTVGMELPCFGIPTLTAGTGRYSGLGFTVDSDSREQYLSRLGQIAEIPPMSPEKILLAKRHAHAVFCRRPWRMTSFRSVFHQRKKGFSPLDYNLHLRARSLVELEDNDDLRLFANWALNSGEIDYIDGGVKNPAREERLNGDRPILR